MPRHLSHKWKQWAGTGTRPIGVNLRIYPLVGVNQRQMRFLAFGGFSTPLNAYTRIQR